MSTRTPARSVKQSPVVKPQTRQRRQPSSTNLSMDKIESMIGHPMQKHQIQPHLRGNHARSSDDSVSPEPLSEILMRPPPLPQQSDKSPRALAPSHNLDPNNPVTPATLMRMPSKQKMSALGAEAGPEPVDEVMEDIMLPDAAAPTSIRSPLPGIDTAFGGTEDQSTPTLSAKSAKVSANSTPRSALPKSGSQESFSKPAKIEGEGDVAVRSVKARLLQLSRLLCVRKSRPASVPWCRLQVRLYTLSLFIANLETGPGMSHLSAETSALYLASKSNYQNIIDGTHLPGVSYPEALAENLSSKRTSHKIAEQGRRNRINLALKEIEALLPPSITTAASKREKNSGASENENGEKGGPSIQGASKASTVEMAIVYIRSLQAELTSTKAKLETAEKRLAEGSSSTDSQASD
jgi:Helix-loop-helix DNA-binding domain